MNFSRTQFEIIQMRLSLWYLLTMDPTNDDCRINRSITIRRIGKGSLDLIYKRG